MGILFVIAEPTDVQRVKTMFAVKYNELSDSCKRLYDYIAMFEKVVIPEAVQRVYRLGNNLLMSNDAEKKELYQKRVHIKTLAARGIKQRLDIKYRDEDGYDKVTHIDAHLEIYLDIDEGELKQPAGKGAARTVPF